MAAGVPQEERAFRSVRRICYSGLDSVTLREEAARRIGLLIPFDAFNFATTDPDTGLFTHAVTGGIPEGLGRAWIEHLYPHRVAGEIIDMARTGTTVTSAASDVIAALLRPEGFSHDLRGVLCGGRDPWGFLCLLRAGPAQGFDAREVRLLRRLAPHLARGLRTAALVDGADGNGDGNGGASVFAGSDGWIPGVLLLDGRGRPEMRNTAASVYLGDLQDVGRGPEEVPYVVASTVARLLHRLAAEDPNGGGPSDGELRVRGRSGRWYTLRASLTEPDPAGTSHTIVLIEPARPGEVALLLTRLYGLTPREREILALAAKGNSTKRIARQLGISPYTVQEHLGNACSKVGVRTRKELLAKLFFDGYAPGLAR